MRQVYVLRYSSAHGDDISVHVTMEGAKRAMVDAMRENLRDLSEEDKKEVEQLLDKDEVFEAADAWWSATGGRESWELRDLPLEGDENPIIREAVALHLEALTQAVRSGGIDGFSLAWDKNEVELRTHIVVSRPVKHIQLKLDGVTTGQISGGTNEG